MMYGKYWTALIASLILGYLSSLIVSMFTPNYYLAYLVTDVVMAFSYAFFFLPKDRLHFYRSPVFHRLFSMDLVLFVGFTLLLSLVGLF